MVELGDTKKHEKVQMQSKLKSVKMASIVK